MQNAITMYSETKQPTDEEKVYLVLITGSDEDGEPYKDFDFIVGSDNVLIRIMDDIDNIDIFNSMVVLQDKSISLLNRVSVLEFFKLRLAKTANYPCGNDLVRLGYSDFDLNNFVENALMQNGVSANQRSQNNVNTSEEEDLYEYETVEGGDV